MKRGIYRLTTDDAGDCARVGWEAGDGAPFLSREIYEMLGFHPPFEALPDRDDFMRAHRANLHDVKPVPECRA